MPNNPNAVANLKHFKKGDPKINRKGRPKKLPPLDELLADVLGEEKDGIEAAKMILLALRRKAMAGDIKAAEALLNRGYGMPKQSTEIKHDLGNTFLDYLQKTDPVK